MKKSLVFALICLISHVCLAELDSWNDTAAKQRIVDFVKQVTDPGSHEFTPVKDRIAVFDNDGTLWLEKPLYPQIHFVMQRLADMARQDPRLAKLRPYKQALQGNLKFFESPGLEQFDHWILLAHAGMSQQAFQAQ